MCCSLRVLCMVLAVSSLVLWCGCNLIVVDEEQPPLGGGAGGGDLDNGMRLGETTNSGCLGMRDGEEPGVFASDAEFEAAGVDYPGCDDDEIVYTVEAGTLTVVHQGATYNCCLEDIAIALDAVGNELSLMELEVVPDPCRCLCCFDIETEITDIDPGTYTMEFCWLENTTGEEQCDTQEVVIP